MDEENHQTSRLGSNGSPARASAAQRPDGSESSSTIAYYGDAAGVRGGFALALELLGLSAPMVNGVTHGQAEDGE